MATILDDALPSAADCRKTMAEHEAEKAAEYVRRQAAVQAKKKELLERFEKPSGVSDEDRMKRAASMIKAAMANGLMEVEVGRFPNTLCSDRGRAINQQEAGWETTLQGLPKELFQFWKVHLQPKGYRIKCQIADWPNGMPGDFSMTLSWDEK